MLVTNEILVRQGVGKYAVAAELLDMAVTGQLCLHRQTGTEANDETLGFTLEYTPSDPPQADENQRSLLDIVFDKTAEPGDSVSFAELAERENFVPRLDKLQTKIRRNLSQGTGDERYYGMDPVRFNKLWTPARVIGGLAFLGIYFASNKVANFELPFAKIGGWVGGLLAAAAVYYELFGELREKLGMQPRALNEALPELRSIQDDIRRRFAATLFAPASVSEKDAYANDPDVRLSYQRALALSIPLGWYDEWLHHFCKVSHERPAWLVSEAGEQGLESFRSDMRAFIRGFEAILSSDAARKLTAGTS